MDMLTFYDICFKVGVLFTVVSFVLGQLFDFMDFDGDLDLDGDVHGLAVSPFKPVVITAFITVFGGAGLMASSKGFNPIATFAIAVVSAFIIAGLFFKLVIVPLHKAQNTSAISQHSLIGHKAKVDLSMTGGAFGKITYIIGGNTYTAPAKSENGDDILKGEAVTISAIKDNVFYVSRSIYEEEKEIEL